MIVLVSETKPSLDYSSLMFPELFVEVQVMVEVVPWVSVSPPFGTVTVKELNTALPLDKSALLIFPDNVPPEKVRLFPLTISPLISPEELDAMSQVIK